jgi:hypothetical protein
MHDFSLWKRKRPTLSFEDTFSGSRFWISATNTALLDVDFLCDDSTNGSKWPGNLTLLILFVFFFGATTPQWARVSSFPRFLDHTQRRTTAVGFLWMSDQLVAETSTWQHTQHSQQTNVHAPVAFEPTISPGERPQTCSLDRAATGTGWHYSYISQNNAEVFLDVTRYGLEGPGIENRWGRDFLHQSRLALGPT